MEDVRGLKELQLDALREVANIGAGHAATALSQMTNRTIMIAVPEVNVRPLEEVTDLVGSPDEVVAAVLMHMMGDLTGRTLVLFPEGSARTLCDILFRRSAGTTGEFGPMEQSGLKEAGNILASAYMNALSDFMGMMLVPSVPSLVVDLSAAVLTTTYLNFGHDRDFVFCVETSFRVEGTDRAAARPLPAPARHAVAAGHLRRHPPDLIRCPGPCCRSAISPSCGPLPAGSIPPTPAPTTTSGVLYYQKGLIEDAIAEFVRALELDPRMQVAQSNLDIAYRESGHYDRRITELRERVAPRTPRIATRAGSSGAPTRRSAATPTRSPSSRRCSPGSPPTCPPCCSSAWPRRPAATSTPRRDWLARACAQDPGQRGRAVLPRRGALQPRPERAGARGAARGDRAGTPTTPRRTISSPSSTATWAGTRRRARRPSAPSSSTRRWRGPRPISRSSAMRPNGAAHGRGQTARQRAPADRRRRRRWRTTTSGSPSGRRACTRRRCASTGWRSRRARTAG